MSHFGRVALYSMQQRVNSGALHNLKLVLGEFWKLQYRISTVWILKDSTQVVVTEVDQEPCLLPRASPTDHLHQSGREARRYYCHLVADPSPTQEVGDAMFLRYHLWLSFYPSLLPHDHLEPGHNVQNQRKCTNICVSLESTERLGRDRGVPIRTFTPKWM